jgi:hypothetical protein
VSQWITSYIGRLAALPLHTRVVLTLACTVFVLELVLRRCAPRSRLYAGWKRVFEAIGHVWTVVILSIIYLVAVGPISLVMRLQGKDLLDRLIRASETSAWRGHEPNPLGPEAAARHQF